MLQRIQSVYLLIAALLLIAFLFLPLVKIDGMIHTPQENTPSLIVNGIAILFLLFTIFQFKNRKQQIRLTRIGIICVLVNLLVTCYFIAGVENISALQWGIAAIFISILFITLAGNAIKKDEKMVRDMDRLR